MKRTLIIAALAFSFSISALAQGQDALPFTRIDRDPALSGMAGASVASSDQASWSAFRNAAVLPFFQGSLDAGIGYQLWAPSTAKSSNINVGVAYKFSDRIGLSLGFTSQSGNPYDVVNSDGEVSGTFRPTDMVVALGFGVGLGEKFSLGINGRYVNQRLGEGLAYNGFNADLMLMFKPSDLFQLAAGVSTLGNSITAVTREKFAQPAHAVLGAEFKPIHGLKIDAEAEYYFSKNFAAAIGAEYCIVDIVYVRAGYRYASAACVIPSHLALGLGAKFKGFRLDVSYLTASPALGNTLNIGIGFDI